MQARCASACMGFMHTLPCEHPTQGVGVGSGTHKAGQYLPAGGWAKCWGAPCAQTRTRTSALAHLLEHLQLRGDDTVLLQLALALPDAAYERLKLPVGDIALHLCQAAGKPAPQFGRGLLHPGSWGEAQGLQGRRALFYWCIQMTLRVRILMHKERRTTEVAQSANMEENEMEARTRGRHSGRHWLCAAPPPPKRRLCGATHSLPAVQGVQAPLCA